MDVNEPFAKPQSPAWIKCVFDVPTPPLPAVSIKTAMLVFAGIIGIIGLLVGVAVAEVAIASFRGGDALPGPARVYEIAIFAQLLGYPLMCGWTLWVLHRSVSLRDLGFVRPQAKDIRPTLVALLVMVIATEILSLIMTVVTGGQIQPSPFGDHPTLGTTIAVVIMAVVLAPFTEELLFRVVLFNALRSRMALWTAVGLSGLGFSIAHGEPAAILPLWAAGIVLAAVYYRSRNAYLAMLCHGSLNLIGVVELLAKHPA